jgi:hypothetical protein
MRPIHDLTQAVTMPFKALFVVGLCAAINAMTPGPWWFQWVALGMGIATVVALAKGIRTALLLGLVAWAGWWLYKRYGAEARERFHAWAAAEKPDSAGAVIRQLWPTTSR